MSGLVYCACFSCVLPGFILWFLTFATVTVISVCQFDLAVGCPDIWLNVILVSVGVFLDESKSVEQSRLLFLQGRLHPISGGHKLAHHPSPPVGKSLSPA